MTLTLPHLYQVRGRGEVKNGIISGQAAPAALENRPMQIFYSDTFVLPLPDGHRFPMEKYALLRERVAASGIVAPADLRLPEPASDADLLRAQQGPGRVVTQRNPETRGSSRVDVISATPRSPRGTMSRRSHSRTRPFACALTLHGKSIG